MNYIDALASEIESNLAEGDRPDRREQELYRLYALLVLVKGTEVSLGDVHQAWSVWMVGDNPEHPALVPFDELSTEQQHQDSPYAVAIRKASLSWRAMLESDGRHLGE